MSHKLQWHRQTDFNKISQFVTAKTKLTDNNESKRKINGEVKKKLYDKRNSSNVTVCGRMVTRFSSRKKNNASCDLYTLLCMPTKQPNNQPAPTSALSKLRRVKKKH